jgi:hypothetical protein
VTSAHELAASPEHLEWLFYVDADDKASARAIEALSLPGDVQIVTGGRLDDQSYWNRLAERADADLIFLGADDLAFRSPNWDLAVRAAFESAGQSEIAMVWADDGDFGERLSTHPFVTRSWIETVGFIVPPYFKRCFVDPWFFELAVLTGLGHYLPQVLIEHCHIELGKAAPDALYEEIRERPFEHRQFVWP